MEDNTPQVLGNLPTGAFAESLLRNNRKIREDRAIAIAEDAETIYRRTVEDLKHSLKKLRRDRESLLDLSPTSADSLKLASDFDAVAWSTKDLEMGVQIRNIEIKLEIAEGRYNHLFGS
jgi:hypothetical protein